VRHQALREYAWDRCAMGLLFSRSDGLGESFESLVPGPACAEMNETRPLVVF
jgi:hypothetical protein